MQSALNQPQSDTASYVVVNSSGTTVFTSTPVPLALGITSALTTVNLGTLDTTGLAQGAYTLVATIFDSSGNPIPNSVGQGTLFVGLPVTASVDTTPTTVPTGSDTVNTTVQVQATTTFPSPLTPLGQVSTGDNEYSAVLYPNGNQELSYAVGSNGIAIIDVTDPSNPMLLSTFAQDVVVKGGLNVAQVVGHDLIVATQLELNASGFNLIVYDLSNPLAPSLVSNTSITQRFLDGMFVQGNVALFTLDGFNFSGGDIFNQFGNLVAVNISNLSQPTVAGLLFGSGNPGAGNQEYGDVIVNDQLAYVTTNGSTGGDTQSGVGQMLLVNISNPDQPTLSGTLDIPGTVEVGPIALQGNTALVVGDTGGLLNPFSSLSNVAFTGNITLTKLDISDPQNPTILGTLVTEATAPPGDPAPLSNDLVNLGNGLYALSDVLVGGKPALMLIDASNPNNIVVSNILTPTAINGLTVSGNTLYAGTPDGLVTYNIGQLVSAPVTVSVQVPSGPA